jgi:hypothetical protein
MWKKPYLIHQRRFMPPILLAERKTRSLHCGRDDVKEKKSTKVDF